MNTEINDGSFDAGLIELSRRFRGVPVMQTDIAFVCGVSRQRVEQIEKMALRKMRQAVAAEDLELLFRGIAK